MVGLVWAAHGSGKPVEWVWGALTILLSLLNRTLFQKVPEGTPQRFSHRGGRGRAPEPIPAPVSMKFRAAQIPGLCMSIRQILAAAAQ